MSENLWPSGNPKENAAQLYRSCAWEVAGDPGEGAYKAAYWLFSELIERIGVNDAQETFLHVIDELSDITKNHDKSMLLFRLNMMRDKKTGKRKPNNQQLAREIAAENDAFNKSPKRNGAPERPTNQSSIEQQIKRLKKAKDVRRLATQGPSPQPRKKRKTARKIAYAGKPHQPKRKITQR